MIRCINRLEEHDGGRIFVLGTELNDDVGNIDEIRREVGMVFQHFNLFPHMTVLENCVLAPMLVRGISRSEAEATAKRYLEMVWMPLSPDGIAMCQTRGVEAQAIGEGIHGKGYHHRRRSGKERVSGSRRWGRRVRPVSQEAVAFAVRAVHGKPAAVPGGNGSLRQRTPLGAGDCPAWA